MRDRRFGDMGIIIAISRTSGDCSMVLQSLGQALQFCQIKLRGRHA